MLGHSQYLFWVYLDFISKPDMVHVSKALGSISKSF